MGAVGNADQAAAAQPGSRPRGAGAGVAGGGLGRLAADLGFSGQAHLVRDFTATVGMAPAAYAAACAVPDSSRSAK
ncbi:hypothetical protein [Catellatospora tritici]|uniref:hypothetical protein n=1 Tax=Catellatospora tritici TaxID=2851566 RepID=UPI001C2D083C|nr:hypothetical protein [Catellatospora tritici]MBV1853581.1 hypothetical protein [Catellatospora tritici]